MLAVETKSRRELALERALAALVKVAHPSKDVVADMIIMLIGAEGARRRGEPEVVRQVLDGRVYVRDAAAVRRALHVELVRMGLPAEVVVALKGGG